MKIVHVITGLSTGGAETMLYKLLSKMNRERFSPVVISLIDRGTFGDRIEALGITVHTIGMKPGIPAPNTIWQFTHKVRQLKPDLIQGWMYHGNLAVQLSGTLSFKSVPILWNIRQSLYSLTYEKPGTSAVIKLLAQLSSFPKKILYNSKTSASQHEKIGYRETKTIVIPNGFDTEVFTPSVAARISIRRELGVTNDTFLIGLICRYHPMKDHANFFYAAAILLKNYSNVQFVLSGQGCDWKNQTLCKLIYDLGIVKHIHLLGERHDMPCLTAALDIASSSSAYGEGFANVIGEAMSCGVPCVVTDVGDSGWIVGNTGRIVPPRDLEALANAWKELIDLGAEGRETLGSAARARIIEYFSLDSVVAQYERLYESVLVKKLN